MGSSALRFNDGNSSILVMRRLPLVSRSWIDLPKLKSITTVSGSDSFQYPRHMVFESDCVGPT